MREKCLGSVVLGTVTLASTIRVMYDIYKVPRTLLSIIQGLEHLFKVKQPNISLSVPVNGFLPSYKCIPHQTQLLIYSPTVPVLYQTFLCDLQIRNAIIGQTFRKRKKIEPRIAIKLVTL